MRILITFSVAIILLFTFLWATPHLSMIWGNKDASRWYYVSTFPETNEGRELDTVLLGDSRSHAAWKPDTNKSHYNLSLGGGTPIEGLKTLEELISHDIKIKNLILSYSPSHLMYEDSYWKRTVNFQYIPFWRHYYLKYLSNSLEDTQYFGRDFGYWDFALPGSKVDQITYSLDGTRKRLSKLNYDRISSRHGHSFYGTNKGISGLPEEFLRPMVFSHSNLADHQIKEIIKLANSNGMDIYWLYVPYSNFACQRLPEQYIEGYSSYVDSLGLNKINRFGCVENSLFGDNSHLYEGANLFSIYLNKYLEQLN